MACKREQARRLSFFLFFSFSPCPASNVGINMLKVRESKVRPKICKLFGEWNPLAVNDFLSSITDLKVRVLVLSCRLLCFFALQKDLRSFPDYDFTTLVLLSLQKGLGGLDLSVKKKKSTPLQNPPK